MKLEAKSRLKASMPTRETWEALTAVRAPEWSYKHNGKSWYSVYLHNAKKKLRRMKDTDLRAALETLVTVGSYEHMDTDPANFGFVGLDR